MFVSHCIAHNPVLKMKKEMMAVGVALMMVSGKKTNKQTKTFGET